MINLMSSLLLSSLFNQFNLFLSTKYIASHKSVMLIHSTKNCMKAIFTFIYLIIWLFL